MAFLSLLLGGGDLASGVALRLFRAGIPVIITELPQPLAVRRTVSFAQAMYSADFVLEGVRGRRAENFEQAGQFLMDGIVPVIADPELAVCSRFSPNVLIDGRMTKKTPDLKGCSAPLVIGLGPGFTAGEDCQAVIETKRGPYLGRVLWSGSAEADTGQPERVGIHQDDRVLRAPADGLIKSYAQIGDHLKAGQVVVEVAGIPVAAVFEGYLRGLLQDGLSVRKGLKIGDVDPRLDANLCYIVSDKALSIGGGVLEAILSRPDLRRMLWT
ncbi:MAG: selenium-dependent molybdenum cofactor biosynthesis protein YqeB [Anaerolineaceae bacterium]|nr:selenium-dependent molybdenum cofactor biosynthesis protein YqeB [Anaerolineaceae bacterium]